MRHIPTAAILPVCIGLAFLLVMWGGSWLLHFSWAYYFEHHEPMPWWGIPLWLTLTLAVCWGLIFGGTAWAISRDR